MVVLAGKKMRHTRVKVNLSGKGILSGEKKKYIYKNKSEREEMVNSFHALGGVLIISKMLQAQGGTSIVKPFRGL